MTSTVIAETPILTTLMSYKIRKTVDHGLQSLRISGFQVVTKFSPLEHRSARIRFCRTNTAIHICGKVHLNWKMVRLIVTFVNSSKPIQPAVIQ